jgi:hypothetical protein
MQIERRNNFHYPFSWTVIPIDGLVWIRGGHRTRTRASPDAAALGRRRLRRVIQQWGRGPPLRTEGRCCQGRPPR